jgi:hypothetical protein
MSGLCSSPWEEEWREVEEKKSKQYHKSYLHEYTRKEICNEKKYRMKSYQEDIHGLKIDGKEIYYSNEEWDRNYSTQEGSRIRK